MLKAVTDSSRIDITQARFNEILLENSQDPITCQLGTKNGSGLQSVYWLPEYGFWYSPRGLDNRYWNAFGTEQPRPGRNLSIVCEINFAYNGERNLGAGIVTEEDNTLYICHSGRIGGGRPGIGKTLFMRHYRGERTVLTSEDSEVAVVGSLEDPAFCRQLADFILEMERIKAIPGDDGQSEYLLEDRFFNEFDGIKEYEIEKGFTVNCTHGMVVNSLARVLEQSNYRIGNDRLRDLFIIGRNKSIAVLFEVKTDTDSSSLYKAVGQLLLNAPCEDPPLLVGVFPSKLDTYISERLRNLGVNILTYALSETGQVEFEWANPSTFMGSLLRTRNSA